MVHADFIVASDIQALRLAMASYKGRYQGALRTRQPGKLGDPRGLLQRAFRFRNRCRFRCNVIWILGISHVPPSMSRKGSEASISPVGPFFAEVVYTGAIKGYKDSESGVHDWTIGSTLH